MATSDASIVYDQHDEEHNARIHEKKYHANGHPHESKESPIRSRHLNTRQRQAIQDISPIKYE
jgi:hypothetical protein